MRQLAFWCLALLTVVSGCTSRFVDFAPDEEAVYAYPLEEVWPRVRTYYSENGFSYRETPGVLQTDWREEFSGSKVAGYWHRYLVIAKPEGSRHTRVLVIRESRSANEALTVAGSDLSWAPIQWGDLLDSFMTVERVSRGEVGMVRPESAQTARDRVLEWKMFRQLAPVLAREAKKSSDTPEVVVRKGAGIECGVPILGLGQVARRGNVVLLGELHGTQQVPHFLAQSTCQTALQGVPVSVGLEIPVMNQERLQTFLASAGKERDWAKLLESPFWHSPYPDGRNSEAVLFLIETLRKLRGRGLDVDVFAFDHPLLEGNAREEAMAKTVLEVAGHDSKRAVLVVSGNLHPRQVKGLPWDPDYRPMGLRIADQYSPVYSLDLAYDSGTAWNCSLDEQRKLDCGVKPTRGQDNGGRYFVHLFNGRNGQGYHGIFYVGAVSASLPAVYQGVEPAGDAQASLPESGNP
ncbi:MAG TPA: hypothetical protein VEU33_46075 [Archangium sp.]|nr:hypothetical protein [Archangium sp.]